MYSIKNFEPRLYQETILNSSTSQNTLISLPTGLGKTKTSILIAINRLKKHPNSKILFLTPTKPLANQIYEEFKESTNIEEIVLFTGAILPEKRQILAKNATIIISTPQSIENDIINKKFSFEDVSLIVFDEAHRAVQNYSYTWLAKKYNNDSKHSRIIGLTASPGSDLEKIKEVCSNLFIENIEIRTENDSDVKQYVQETKIELIKVNLPEKFKEAKTLLENANKQRLTRLKELNYSKSNKYISKKDLLKIMARLQGEVAKGSRNSETFNTIACTAETIKINHTIDLIETQGIISTYSYLKSIIEGSGKNKSKSAKNLSLDMDIKSAYFLIKNLYDEKINHPKEEKLEKLVKEELKNNSKSKIIIFNQYRDSAKRLETKLNKIKEIKPKLFVGQMKKKGTGLSQKEQIEILKDFENNKYNCLISTSIGEEGLDIPKVESVIFYEPIPSAIRSIQRRGRTARHAKGKVIVLMTKNTRDEAYHWTSFHKEKRMHEALKKLKGNMNLENQQNLKNYSQKTNLKIYADSREQGSSILKELDEIGLNLTVKSLNVADFIVSNKVGIERKTKQDFVNSIIDKRLITQLKELKNNFEKPLIILEGDEDIYSIRNIHPNAIRGMLATITISYGIPIIYTKDFKETAEMIKIIASREQIDSKKEFVSRIEKKPLTTKKQQEFIIESLPGVGPSLAKGLLKKFKTIKKIINSSENELKEIEKLGQKKAKNIQEILEEIYED